MALVGCLVLGSCVAGQIRGPKRAERGIIFDHDVHTAANIECAACHGFDPETPIGPSHELCGACHAIPEHAPTEAACGLCHTEPDYAVTPREARIDPERAFDHNPHLLAGIACDACHGHPDKNPLPGGWLKPMCLDCHDQVDPALNECSVCHERITKDTVPTMRQGARVLHDSKELWDYLHGRESNINPMYCAQCHTDDECAQCHRVEKPRSHTTAFIRRTHGLQAGWDRNRCSVCHEEDSCLQCHRDTKPRSHRGGFEPPRNGHCVECHYPIEETNCTVCHERIDHQSADISPHVIGIYPPDCGRCHPAGLPHRAPHPLNPTTRCSECHYP